MTRNSTSGNLTKENKTNLKRYPLIKNTMFISALYTTKNNKNFKTPVCPLTDEWIQKI